MRGKYSSKIMNLYHFRMAKKTEITQCRNLALGKQEIEFMKAWHGLPVIFTNATKRYQSLMHLNSIIVSYTCRETGRISFKLRQSDLALFQSQILDRLKRTRHAAGLFQGY